MKEFANDVRAHRLTRRSFLKTAAAAGAIAAGAGVLSGCQSVSTEAAASGADEREIVTMCRANCNWGCLHKITVRDGVACKATKADFPGETYTGICLRGISNVHRCYSPDRIMYPMRRVEGTERGAGQWERLSWDEAIAEIHDKFQGFMDEYGPQSIVKDAQSGNNGMCNTCTLLLGKLASCMGWTSTGDVYDRNSCDGTYRVMGVNPYDFSNEPAALLDSKMIVVWGTNPVYTEPHVWRHIRMAQDRGCKVVTIDPMKSATAHKSDQWISVKPGSDLSFVLAACNYFIQNDLIDREFVMNRTNLPFLVREDTGEMHSDVEFTATVQAGSAYSAGALGESAQVRTENDYYVIDATTGQAVPFAQAREIALEGRAELDGVPLATAFTLMKEEFSQYSMSWAAETMDVDEETLVQLANDFATIGPVTINITYGMDHYMNGNVFFQAVSIMQGLVGNLGRPGAGFTGMFMSNSPMNTAPLASPLNPVAGTEIPSFLMYDVWRDQRYHGESFPVKGLITGCSNPMSNYADQNRWFSDVFPNLEYWVVLDHEWTDSARHADLVLPVSFWYEFPDIRMGQNTPYATYGEAVIDQMYESKTDSQILTLIAQSFGFEDDFPTDMTLGDYVELFCDSDAAREQGITYEKLQEQHACRYIGDDEDSRVYQGGPWNPFPTSHGRLTMYWEDPQPRVDYGQEFTDEEIRRQRLPYWYPPTEAWEGTDHMREYPIVFLQCHERYRTHTQYFGTENLLEIEDEPYMRIAREDAQARGVETEDYIEVFNDRGHVVVKARIDDNVRPGMSVLPKGWQRHQFKEGGYAELIGSQMDAWGVSAVYYDCTVDFRKYEA